MKITDSNTFNAFKSRAVVPVVALLTILAPAAVHAAPAGEATSIVPIAKTIPATIKTTHAPDADPGHYQVLDGTHFSYRCYVPYTLKTKEAAVEVCEIDPVKLQILGWPETEVIHLIRGKVTITGAGGEASSYSDGDIFVLPQGFQGMWQQSDKLLKVVVRHPLFWKD
ncbi:cupin domain-containing protein [Massilia sp. P8910]|uniref:cupin domain-containing protein n=1 Tax=Massilia antarctica TaxID=2765360 RepID=UPI001E59A204|nr:cupin domain-containing protein [Massilia antarctica]MCE3602172.1 cupin domain-containing protein [Massilia antarctica]